MPVGYVHAGICEQDKLHLGDFNTPIGGANVEAAGNGRETEQVVKGVLFVVIQDDHLVLKHVLHVFFRVKVEPVLKTESAELVKHLLLLEEVDLVRLLTIAFFVDSDELEQEVLADLGHWLGHENFAFELGMHRKEWSSVQFLESRHEHDLQIFHFEHVEVAEVELCSAPINEKLAVDLLVKGGAVGSLSLRQGREFLPL